MKQAIALLEKANAQSPENTIIGARLGELLLRDGQAESAAIILTTVIRLAPTKHTAHQNLGIAYLDLNRPKKAIRAFKNALKRNPDWPDALWSLSIAYSAVGNPTLENEALKRLIEMHPDHRLAKQAMEILP
jgi:predicted Zn-dependent protease